MRFFLHIRKFCCTFAFAVFIVEKEVEDQLKKWKAYYQKDNINQ